MKKIIAIFLALMLLTSLYGCGTDGNASQGSGESGDATSVKVGAVLGVGGLGDQAFNDLIYAGLEQAKNDLGIEYDYVEPKQVSDFELFLREMAADGTYSVIISVGFEQQDALATVAAEFPEQKFGYIDGVVEAPNIASYTTADAEGAFLIGAMAGLMKSNAATYGLNTQTEIGFIGAVDVPLINRFRAGYEAGARYVNPDLTVQADYVGSFDDVTMAKEIANTMNTNGIDVILPAAGGAALGVFQSAAENDYIIFGGNSNQNPIEPDHIAASMLKRVDAITYDIIQSVCDGGTFQGGQAVEVGFSEEGIGYTCEGSNIALSQDLIDQVEAIKAKIESGELSIPSEMENVDAFLSENHYQP